MLEFLRRSASSLFAWVILGVLAIVFGLSFGLPSDSITVGPGSLVTVHGEGVGNEDYRYQYNITARVRRIPSEPKIQQQLKIKEIVLDGIVERILLARAAESIGLTATTRDAELLTRNGHVIVMGDTKDWLGDIEFNYQNLFKKSFLPSLEVTEAKYFEYQRQEVLARTLRDLVSASLAVSEGELREAYEATANRLSIKYVRFEATDYAELVDPTAEEIEAYVTANQADLDRQFEAQGMRFTKLPKQMRLQVIRVDKPEPVDGGDADEAATKAAKDTIEAARTRTEGGEDFRVVARELSQDDAARRGGDFGWIGETAGSGLDPVVDEAAAKLKDGEVSAALEGEDAWFLVRLVGRREGDVDKADGVRELAAEGVQRARGLELAQAAAQEAVDSLKEGNDPAQLFEMPAALGTDGAAIEALADASKGKRPEVQLTGMFGKDQPIPGVGTVPELTKAVWNAETDDFVARSFETQSGFIIAARDRKETSSDDGFAEARADLFTGLTRQKAALVVGGWGQRLCNEAKARGDIVPEADKLARLMTYDTKEEGRTTTYSVCDQLGAGMMQPPMFGGVPGG